MGRSRVLPVPRRSRGTVPQVGGGEAPLRLEHRWEQGPCKEGGCRGRAPGWRRRGLPERGGLEL